MMEVITKPLGHICDEGHGIIRTGPFGSQLHQSDYDEDGTPVIMPKNIIGGKVSTEDIAHVGEKHVLRLSQHRLEVGDIVYGRRGDIGRHAFIRERERGWLCGTGCLRIALGDSVLNPKFLHYYLDQEDVIDWITKQAVGATMPNLNTSILRSMPVTFPPLHAQRNIAAILSAYDDLIENNLRRIKILEEMAQNLYCEWFVKFRFPGWENARFVDSPLGRIPEGWDVVKLGDLIEIRKGKNITKNTVVPGSVPVVAGGMSPAYFHNTANTQQPVITISASGANAGYVCLYHENVWASDCSVIDFNTTPHVYFFYLQFKERQTEVTRLQRGSAQPHVYPKDLMDLDAIKGSIPILDRFHDNAAPALQMIRNLTLKNTVLRRTRDLLLPRLISGELDVSELDITVPEEIA